MAGSDCPRCGSSDVVPVVHAVRTLAAARGERTPTASREAFEEWACGDCGFRWPQTASIESPRAGDRWAITISDPEVGVSAGALERGSSEQDAASVLRRTREERGMTLTEVSRATGIWERYLRALEEDESEDALSGQAYARFFLREYAQHLGLDAEPLLRARAARHAPEDEGLEAIEPLPDPRHRARLLGRALAWISVVVLVGLVVGSQLPRDDETTPVQGAAVASPSASAAVPPPTDSSPPPTIARHVRVVLEANEPCWVGAVVDGVPVADVTLAPGERTTLRADRAIELRLGNAGGVDLLVNGDPYAPGGAGEVVDLTLRLLDGQVVVTRA